MLLALTSAEAIFEIVPGRFAFSVPCFMDCEAESWDRWADACAADSLARDMAFFSLCGF